MSINTKQKLAEYLKRKLGSPVINLEFENAQIMENIDDAVQRFAFYSSDATYRSTLVFPLTGGVSTYTLPESVASVVNLDLSGSFMGNVNLLFSPMNRMYEMGFFDMITNAGAYGSLTAYEIGMQYLELLRKELTAEFFLEFNKYTRVLTVTPAPSENMIGVLEIYSKVDPGTGASEIYNEIWIKEYALALCKLTLGHIWGKYNGTTLPGGGTIDSQTIRSEGKDEKKQLEEDLIKKYSEPLGLWLA